MDNKKRDFRPKVHFTPPAMVINDPNGLVYADGVWHLFYQYYPYALSRGAMHWGHAVSKDLLHWQHLPVALYPDELGCIFSGSCLYDRNNASGLGGGEGGALLAFYTNHDLDRGTESQSMAYSTDGVHFEKTYRNPVIPNPGFRDFRDPKVFLNGINGGFGMVLAAGDHVQFWKSQNLVDWVQSGEFGKEENPVDSIFECPDLFAVTAREDGRKLWTLPVSMPFAEHYRKAVSQYFLGEFDGETFRSTKPCKEPLWLDYGFDYFAGTTFQNYSEPVMMGVAMNWLYALQTPTGEYRGQLSFPRKLSLSKTGRGDRLKAAFWGLEKYKAHAFEIQDSWHPDAETFGLILEGGPWRLTLQNQRGNSLIVQITDGEVAVDRSNAGLKDFDENYASLRYSAVHVPRYTEGGSRTELLFDVSVLEVLAEDGLIPITMTVYPEVPYDRICIDGDVKVFCYYLE